MNLTCELCRRQVLEVTRHHLIPRTMHHNKRVKKRFSREQMVSSLAMLCRPCHSQVHAVFTEKQLLDYTSVQSLQSHPAMVRFLNFIRRKPAGYIPKYSRYQGG